MASSWGEIGGTIETLETQGFGEKWNEMGREGVKYTVEIWHVLCTSKSLCNLFSISTCNARKSQECRRLTLETHAPNRKRVPIVSDSSNQRLRETDTLSISLSL